MKFRKDAQEPTITAVEGLSVTRTEHPAFAMIGAHHVHGPRVLFGSDFEHHGYIDIVIKRATSERRHSTDNFHGKEELISVSLSRAQWATFLSSMNLGDGVPCTLSHIKREQVPQIALPIPDKEKFRADHQAVLDEAIRHIDGLLAQIGAGKIPAGLRAELTNTATQARRCIQDRLPFVRERFEEHLEESLENAKTEVHGYIHMALQRAGLNTLSSTSSPALPSDQQPLLDGTTRTEPRDQSS